MLTRSKAKQLEQRTQYATTQAVFNRHGLPRTSTEMLIGPSATGQGTHIRWIRPDAVQTSAGTAEKVRAEEEELEYITPAPTLIQIPGAPQKTLRRDHERIQVNPLLWTLGDTQDKLEEHETLNRDTGYPGSRTPTLGSPFQFSSKETLTRSFAYPAGDSQVHKNQSHPALGPHGTELIDEHGNPMYVD